MRRTNSIPVLIETPIDPSVMKFVNVVFKNAQYTQQSIIEFRIRTLNELQNLFYVLISESERHQQFFSYSKNTAKLFNFHDHICAFIYKELVLLQDQITTEKSNVYTDASRKISELVVCLRKNPDNSTALRFDSQGFLSSLEDMSAKNPTCIELMNQIARLDIYANFFLDPKEFDFDSINEKVKTYADKVNEGLEFCPQTDFDIFLEEYILRKGYNQPIKELADSFIQQIKTNEGDSIINLKIDSINQLISTILMEITEPPNIKYRYLVASSVIRYFFNLVQAEYDIYKSDFDQICNFMHRCNKIKGMTPKELRCSELHIPKGFYDIPLEALCKEFTEYEQVVDLLDQTNYYNNPYDILWLVQRSFKVLESIAERSFQENTNKSKNSGSQLAFDEFFSIYWPLVTINPSPMIYSFTLLIDKISGLDLVNFAFPMSILGSVIHYINDNF